MDNKLNRLIELSNLYTELSNDTTFGLCGVCTNKIHLTDILFEKLSEGKVIVLDEKYYSTKEHRMSFVEEGVTFFCIMK